MSIQLRYAARCEAAGRDYNEDNFLVDSNLSDQSWGFQTDEVIDLKGNGSLLVVCDGMGGMNAGEVASAVAVESIKEWFSYDRLTPDVVASSKSIQQYIHNAIQAADAAIKNNADANPDHKGMGSTIVLAWLINGKVYVGWCGDSRAYRYNPKTGLERLSHDHSYVQELVDAGKLTEELAFDHPNNNIITRSLGDPRGKAQPDVKEYTLYEKDIILLCSDGLCGCLRDNEISEIISKNSNTLQECRDALWSADEAAGWHDNVTVLLAQVTAGAPVMPDTGDENRLTNSAVLRIKNNRLKGIIGALAAIIVLLAAAFLYLHFAKPAANNNGEPEATITDSVSIAPAQPQQEAQKAVSDKPANQPSMQSKAAEKPKEATTQKPKEEKLQLLKELIDSIKKPTLTPIDNPQKETGKKPKQELELIQEKKDTSTVKAE